MKARFYRADGPALEGYVATATGLYDCGACGGRTLFHLHRTRDEGLYECQRCGAVEPFEVRFQANQPDVLS